MTRHTAQDEQVRQGVDDVGRVELASDADRQALPGELVDDVEHTELPAIVGPTLDEVMGPDMVGVFGPKPGTQHQRRQPELLRMTDAERLMRGFIPSLRESPFRIAPERVHDLLAKMGGETWILEIVDGPANFEAFPTTKEIEGTYAALLSLWAVAASVHVLSVLTRTAAEMNLSQILISPSDPGSAAIELKNAALALIRNEELLGPSSCRARCSGRSLVPRPNNLFFAAASIHSLA